MSPGDDAPEGKQVLPGSVDAVPEDFGNTEYLHAVLGLADPAFTSGSRADQGEPQQGRERTRPRAVSCVSYINPDYFDPRGMGALRHSLNRMSRAPSERTQIGRPEEDLELSGQISPTAEAAGEAFDFEAVLRDVLKRCDPQFSKLPIRTDLKLCSQAW